MMPVTIEEILHTVVCASPGLFFPFSLCVLPVQSSGSQPTSCVLLYPTVSVSY